METISTDLPEIQKSSAISVGTKYAVVNEEAVVLLPTHLSLEEAVTLPCAAVTGWVALTGQRRITAGDTV